MKNFLILIMLILGIGMASSAKADDTKVQGRLFANWNMDLTDSAKSANSFNIKRAYITVKSKLSNNTSVRITTDIRETSAFDGYSIILKYGYIDWKPEFGHGNFKTRFGLQPTLYIDNMNKLWGRRYLEKTVGDVNKLLTTSDFGLSALINLGKKGKSGYVALQILNGTKYTDVEELNKNKDFSAFLLLKPFVNNEHLKRSKFLAQTYFGTRNVSLIPTIDTFFSGIDTTIINIANEASQFKNQIISVGGMIGYSNKFDLGFDVNFKTEGTGYADSTGTELNDLNSTGFSLFGALYFESFTEKESFAHSLNLFGRIDILDENTDVDNDGKSLFIVGLESAPTKGLKISLNLRTTSYELDGKDSESQLFLNTLFKF